MGRIDQHWDEVYATKDAHDVSWYQDEPRTSLRLLEEFAERSGGLVDVGAGASTLVDRLLEAGWRDLSVLDVSSSALELTRRRLGVRSSEVEFWCADVTSWEPGRTFSAWHDRAVLHFLLDEAALGAYASRAGRSLGAGGVAVIAAFAPDGPTHCSGLGVAHYDAQRLSEVFERDFTLIHQEREEHVTPAGAVQPFTWVVLRRR